MERDVCIFCTDLFLFSRKFAKAVKDANGHKMADISAPRNTEKMKLYSNSHFCPLDALESY